MLRTTRAFAVAIAMLVMLHAFEPASSLTPDEWKKRTVYQVLTDRFASSSSGGQSCQDLSNYCGGDYKGLIKRLDYITGMGFDAIWITPIVSNIGNGYHGYWLKDLDALNEHFGSQADLQQLVQECHSRGMAVMLDVVGNHVGPVDMDFSRISPFNDASHYHTKCQITDWNDQHQVEYCRLSNLPDLDQSNDYVRSALKDWIHTVVSKYGFDGVRIDTVPEVEKQFWREFSSSAGVFCMGEAYNGNIGYVSGYQADVLDSVLSYPLYFTLRNVYQHQQSMYQIQTTLQQYASAFRDVSVLGTFIDNHDQPRFLHDQGDYTLYENALTYVVMSSGVPIVYYGSEQGYAGGSDPGNRESLWPNYDTGHQLYGFLKKLIGFRKSHDFAAEEQIQRYADDNFYAFSRGDVFVATTNVGSNGQQQKRTITYHPYAEGTTICNMFYPDSDCVTVQSGQFDVSLDKGECKIYSPKN